jgi:hypothetical protein
MKRAREICAVRSRWHPVSARNSLLAPLGSGHPAFVGVIIRCFHIVVGTAQTGFRRNKGRWYAAGLTRMNRMTMKVLKPAIANVLKRWHYPLDVILACVGT